MDYSCLEIFLEHMAEGEEMEWVTPPPPEVHQGETFDVTFSLALKPAFWDWAAQQGVFQHLNVTTAAAAEEWCLSATCEDPDVPVDKDHCCIFHVNIHSCPVATTAVCGPWVQADGALYTHSVTQVGPVQQGHWTFHVSGMPVAGVMEIFGHVKIGGMQITLHANTTVTPPPVCGNSICEKGEDCYTCPADCGSPTNMEPWVLAAVIVAVLLVVIGISGLAYARYRHIKNRNRIYGDNFHRQVSRKEQAS